jgi:hypothetical protein
LETSISKRCPFFWNDLNGKGWMLLMQKAAGRRLQIKVSWAPQQLVERILFVGKGEMRFVKK